MSSEARCVSFLACVCGIGFLFYCFCFPGSPPPLGRSPRWLPEPLPWGEPLLALHPPWGGALAGSQITCSGEGRRQSLADLRFHLSWGYLSSLSTAAVSPPGVLTTQSGGRPASPKTPVFGGNIYEWISQEHIYVLLTLFTCTYIRRIYDTNDVLSRGADFDFGGF